MAAFSTIALLGLAAAGTATTVVGQVKAGKAAEQAGRAQRRAAEGEAELLDFNAGVADLQAQDATDRGAQEEQRFRSQVRGMIGSQRAGYAAGNVDVDYGSAIDVQADTAYLGELDALTIRTNAAREAWGYKVQAVDYRKRAEITRQEGVQYERAGRAARSSANIAAVGTIAGTGASLLMARYGFGRTAPVVAT